ncbi:toll/interleukin-1 receptor domain-containing protein [Faecalibacterium sp. An192]|uniref:toll/interleukin-1 receptor domain-containing protein n=1 Tax=Faecalibacterium sp. An192 TaxID=1965581 RepID=UPI000B3906C4|nr:toll/interleukin-1 receptor domain-containing protein [Faecalibacterium sp. An192]OUP28098.1 hypothetical protein B5F27_07790 [Faecalibacterium sp. An192]
MKESVFISYSSKDFHKVRAIKEILEYNGISCWMAPQSIPTGSSYAKEIPVAIKSCKVFLLMVTSSAQQSQWVPKEMSLALTQSKCVIPFVLEDCTLTDVFNFFLTDVQRYYAFEISSDALKDLIDKIKLECGTYEGAASVVQPGEISEVEIWIIGKDRTFLNRELMRFLSALKAAYKQNPNAAYIDSWIKQYQLDRYGIGNVLEALEKCSVNLTGAAEIYIRLAVIYIHSGARQYIKQARKLLEKAVTIYSSQAGGDEVGFKRIVYARWLMAVTYKQERNFGCANDLCEELVEYIKEENQIFDVPYSDALLLPQRELAVINKEEIMSDYLMAHMEEIRMNPKELFYTQRRLLELFLLNNEFEKARDLLPEVVASFEKCRNHLDEIYHVGLYQNLFEYYSYVGDKESAEQYYRLALENAKKNYWKGKEQKLAHLKEIFE